MNSSPTSEWLVLKCELVAGFESLGDIFQRLECPLGFFSGHNRGAICINLCHKGTHYDSNR